MIASVTFLPALSDTEADQLATYEATIAAGLTTFYTVGAALVAIRDERLYRATHATFEDYCRGRWQMGRAHAYRLIDAAAVVDRVSPIGDIPANEAQARALAAVPDELQAEVWAEVVDTTPADKITAQVITDTAARRGDHRAMNQDSGENRYYTPAFLIDRVRAVLGSIELDPASDAAANQTVQAGRFFTVADDGLAQDWSARTLFLNPPYGRNEETNESNQGRWSAKLLEAYQQRQVDAAILLVNAGVCNHWFTGLKDYPICFPDGRVSFDGPASKDAPTQSTALIYFGSDVKHFAAVFGDVGHIMIPWCMVAALAPLQEVA